MRAWKLVEEPVVGHWTFVGCAEDLLTCRSDWVPVKADRNGLFLCLPVAPLGPYSTVQLPGSGYKELRSINLQELQGTSEDAVRWQMQRSRRNQREQERKKRKAGLGSFEVTLQHQ